MSPGHEYKGHAVDVNTLQLSVFKLGSLDLFTAMSSTRPYIGCKIALISKAQNRYEGFLYTIDRVNSTVVLAKGEWFDTDWHCVSCFSILSTVQNLISIFVIFQSNVSELRVDPLTDQYHLKMKSMIISPSVEVILKISYYPNLQDHTMVYPLIPS